MTVPTNQILNAAASDQELGAAAFRVLFVLTQHANWETGLCFPSQGTIARRLGIARQAVNKSFTQLIERGFLDLVERRQLETGAKSSSVYRLRMPDEPSNEAFLPSNNTLLSPDNMELLGEQCGVATPSQRGVATINLSTSSEPKEDISEDRQAKRPKAKKPKTTPA